MISVAFPRLAPRFAFDARRLRDGRWLALFGLFFAILLVGVVEAADRAAGAAGVTADQPAAAIT
ncbi:MAG: hypothetical protein U5M50_12075 [Sphingobium sp.]|nr:hypothetical protein [Sphingobium sp.]